ncbi:phosphonate metabolism protein PhnM [Rhodomicrobium vannielii ATCC 17100]|uniref:Phosphonate metabolism protein PhnM n=1 Tax=Rhodomicrobium vannielii (strain ATCC 17100 / DSM 162 / LMG 4299 / NCIMB 10020 / ATH 3.1.1) TaxID=648757 RepID=E3I7B9_RHOVT|nr:alpha-D-ribose 1-methylphosphonate 5-triphosphate diphosphatase [Rhodomicrobium vannielii]ADP70770.1 phosphonate metabolism protein PhnM [Rhodomicrobium vannielii ATCC 17100]
MSANELILTNASIVLADRMVKGTLTVKGAVIAGIDEGVSHLPAAIDCEGDLILPGLVELHTDNIERHMMPRPGAAWPVRSAALSDDRELAASGITTVFNAICVGEVHSRSVRSGMVAEIARAIDDHIAAGTLKIDHYFHWRCEVSYPGLPDLLDPLIDNPRLKLISVMDHTPGQRQFVDGARYAEYYQGKFQMTDAELAEFMRTRRRDAELYSASNRRYVVETAHARGVPLASHDDATAAHVDEAIADGVSVAEFPTTLEAAQASHRAGLAVLMGGPNIVRGQSHSGNISALELARAGALDIVSSDYVPAALLWGALKLVSEAGMSLPVAVATVTRNPARAVGFTDRGEIAGGMRADLIRVHQVADLPVIRDVWCLGRKVA